MMRAGHFRHLFNITSNYEAKTNKFPILAHRKISVFCIVIHEGSVGSSTLSVDFLF